MDVARRLLPPLLLAAAAAVLMPSVFSPSDLPCHRDLLDFVLPLKWHFVRSLADGAIPWWDPYTLGGRPFVAVLQSQVFYPPNWLHLVLDLPWALSLFLWGHLLLGGLGARALARQMGLGEAASLLAGAGYLAGGFLPSLTDLSNQLCTAAWLPWTCLAARRFGRDPGPRALAAWSACVLASVLAAAPQHAAVGGLASVAFAAAAGEGASRARWRRACLGGALAAALAFWAGSLQFVPFADLVLHSDRAGDGPIAEAGKHELELAALSSFVRAPRDALDAPGGAFVRSLYLGPWLLALAVVGAALGRGERRLLLAMSLASVWLAFGTGLPGPSRWLAEATPFLRYPIKYLGLAALTLPLLAAHGLEGLLLRLRDSGRVNRVLLALLAWTVPVAGLTDLARAHRHLATALPVHRVLARTPLIDLLAANTRPDGPRVHALPLTRARLRARAALLVREGPMALARDRVELLEGGLPTVFGIHSTWGGAALVPAEQAERLRQAHGPAVLRLAPALRAGFVLAPRGADLPLPRAPGEGGAAELYLIAPQPEFTQRTWQGPNRATGAPGAPPPSADPGWREGPPGTWTYRPRGFGLLVAASLSGCLALAILALRRRPSEEADETAAVDRPRSAP